MGHPQSAEDSDSVLYKVWISQETAIDYRFHRAAIGFTATDQVNNDRTIWNQLLQLLIADQEIDATQRGGSVRHPLTTRSAFSEPVIDSALDGVGTAQYVNTADAPGA